MRCDRLIPKPSPNGTGSAATGPEPGHVPSPSKSQRLLRALAVAAAVLFCAHPRALWADERETVIEDRVLTVLAQHSPTCSGMGDLVAYVADTPRTDGSISEDLYVMSMDGQMVRRLSSRSQVSNPCFSHSGDRVVCAALRSMDEGQEAGIYALTVGSAAARPLAVLVVAPRLAPFAPVFSPDDNTIAYIHYAGDTSSRLIFWTFDMRTGLRKDHPLPEGVTISQRSSYVWVPGGSCLRFLGTETRDGKEAQGLWEIDLGNDRCRRIRELPGDVEISSLALSPNGRRLAYYASKPGEKTDNLVVADQDGNNPAAVVEVEPRPRWVPRVFESDIAWTRDSSGLVFADESRLRFIRLGTEETAALAASRRNLSALYDAMGRYAREHSGDLPTPRHDPDRYRKDDPYFWVKALEPYVSSRSIFYAPADLKRANLSSYELNPMFVGAPLERQAELETRVLMREAEAFVPGHRLALYTDGRIRDEAQ